MSFALSQRMWGTYVWRTLTSSNLKVREMHCWEQVYILPFQGMGLFKWVQRMNPHPLMFPKKGKESFPPFQQTNSFSELLCHLLEFGNNYLLKTLDCRTCRTIPFKPKQENVLMFKAKLTGSKSFDVSCSVTNCEPSIIHGNPSVGTLSIEKLYIWLSNLNEADLICSIQLIKQAHNISIISRAWAQRCLGFFKYLK